ncbi:LysR family transcriptional regulator [Agrobacterium fabrum]|uniref:LysR family transcriptional regulator n=1 Tax=Agrobacterium fabrum TaxID=1176649 RepID=UPI00298EFC1C|nr:LysR family transcriptional regulator [Agrobacterium fabrum]
MSSVEIRTYRYFCAVAESCSVRIASENCSVTQPAISRQVALLEDALGVTLFHRRPSGMILTAAGEALYAKATVLLKLAETAERSISPWKSMGPSFRIACLDTTLHYILAPFIAETDPPIGDLIPERAEDVYSALDQGVDIGVGTATPPKTKESELLARIPVCAQCAEGYLPQSFGGELADLASFPVAIAGHGSAVEGTVRNAAESIDLHLTISHIVSSGKMAQAVAASGKVVAITTEPSQFGLKIYDLLVKGCALTVPLYAVWDAGHPADKAIRKTVRSLSDWIDARQPWRV